MRFGSVCSGIEAASVAFEPLGWECRFVAEIDDFPSAVLAHRYPNVPNLGDMTALDVASLPDIDVLIGGTPCQAFSIAGKRLSLSDARGNLTLAFALLAHELQDKHGKITVIWENVPGALNTEDNAFGCFLGTLVGGRDAVPLPRGFERWPDHGMVAGPRGRAVWRVLDAQWFGLAQRRERVFLVASLGDNPVDPVAVLFEPQGMPGDRPACVAERARSSARSARTPRPKSIWAALGAAFRASTGAGPAQDRNANRDVAPTLPSRRTAGGGSGLTSNATAGLSPYPLNDLDGVSHSVVASGTASGYMDASAETYIAHSVTASDGGMSGKDGGYGIVAHTLTADGFDASEDGTGRGTPLVAVPRPVPSSVIPLQVNGASGSNGCGVGMPGDPMLTLAAQSQHGVAVCFSSKDDGRDITYDLAPTMRAMQHDGSHANSGGQLAVAVPPSVIPIAEIGKRASSKATGKDGDGIGQPGDPMFTLGTDSRHGLAIAFDTTQITSGENRSNPRPGDPCPTLVADMHAAPAVVTGQPERRAWNFFPLGGQGTDIDAAETDISTSVTSVTHGSQTDRGTRVLEQTDVRRLTVVECERLQGFPDNWTLIPGAWRNRKPEDREETVRYLMDAHGLSHNEAGVLADCPDGPRYRALGNSKATHVVRWIGHRLDLEARRHT